MAVDNSPSNSSNLLNITIQNESENYRNIRRNSSNQIVSYTIEEGTQPDEYGFKRIPGEVLRFDANQYKRNIPQISNELLTTSVEFESQIIQQNRLNEEKIYKVQNQSLRSVRGEDEQEPKDTFSGRYELTAEALSRRDKNPGEIQNQHRNYPNTHFGGISWHDDDVRAATDNYITHAGMKELVWDNKAFGPDLQQYGYRVTEELKASGRNLQIRAVVSPQISHPNGDVNFFAAVMRQRPGQTGENNSKQVASGGRKYLQSEQPHWPMIEMIYELTNNQLRVNDLYQITSVQGTRTDGTFIMGDKCVFEVNCLLPNDPPIFYPANNNTGGSNFANNQSYGVNNDVAQTDSSNEVR